MVTHRTAPPSGATGVSVLDPHLTPEQIADAWKLDITTVRRIFLDIPGVLKLGRRAAHGKRSYVTLRIPVEVAERVYWERTK